MAEFYYRDKHAESGIAIGPFASKDEARQAAASHGIALAAVELFKMKHGEFVIVATGKKDRAAIKEALRQV